MDGGVQRDVQRWVRLGRSLAHFLQYGRWARDVGETLAERYGWEAEAPNLPGLRQLAPGIHDEALGTIAEYAGFDESSRLAGGAAIRRRNAARRERLRPRSRRPSAASGSTGPNSRRGPVDKFIMVGTLGFTVSADFDEDSATGYGSPQDFQTLFIAAKPGKLTGFRWTFQLTALYGWPASILVAIYIRQEGEPEEMNWEIFFDNDPDFPGYPEAFNMCGNEGAVICEELLSSMPTESWNYPSSSEYDNFTSGSSSTVRGHTDIERNMKEGDKLMISMRMTGVPLPPGGPPVARLLEQHLVHFFFKT